MFCPRQSLHRTFFTKFTLSPLLCIEVVMFLGLNLYVKYVCNAVLMQCPTFWTRFYSLQQGICLNFLEPSNFDKHEGT